MGSSDSNVWHQVHAQREDGVAAMFLIRDVVPRPDQPKIFVVELPYPVTDLSGQPDAAGYRRLGAFQDQWLEPACAALGWTFVAWKCEDGSFFLYLYGSGDPEALLDELAPFDGELGFFNDLDADWSEYAALRELVEQAEAAQDGHDHHHDHGDGCDHDHDHGDGCDHDHGDGCDHDHGDSDHVHGEGCDHAHHVDGDDGGHADHDHGALHLPPVTAGHAIEVIDLTGEAPTRTWVRPTGVALDDGEDAAPAVAPEPVVPVRAARSRSARRAAPAPSSRPARRARRASTPGASIGASIATGRARPRPAAPVASRPAKRTAATASKTARQRAARDAKSPDSRPGSSRSTAPAAGKRGGAAATPGKRTARPSATAPRATRRRRKT